MNTDTSVRTGPETTRGWVGWGSRRWEAALVEVESDYVLRASKNFGAHGGGCQCKPMVPFVFQGELSLLEGRGPM